MGNSQNPNQSPSQNPNPYTSQNPNQNIHPNDPYSIRTQTPQNAPIIKSTTSIVNPSELQPNPYDSYLNKLQQSYSSQQPRNVTNSATYPLNLNPQQTSNHNLLNTVTNSNPNINNLNLNTQQNGYSNQQIYQQSLNIRPNQQQ